MVSVESEDVLIINCDDTFPLDSVHELVEKSSQATGIKTRIKRTRFQLSDLKETSEKVKSEREEKGKLLCAILVLHAHESRLSVNEKNAGIGYAVLYRALREASEGRTLVVVGGDESSRADRKVVSDRIRYKVASQFDDEYLDGRRGFVFSWGENYYPVHEEAFNQYLHAIGSGEKGLKRAFAPTTHFKTTDQEENDAAEAQKISEDGHTSVASDSKNSLKQHAETGEPKDKENSMATFQSDVSSLTPDQSHASTSREKGDNEDMPAQPKDTASSDCQMGIEKELKNATHDTSTTAMKPRAQNAPKGSPSNETHQKYPPTEERHQKYPPKEERHQRHPPTEERHQKCPGSDDIQRHEIEKRLSKRIQEFDQRYPESQPKLFGVLRNGKLDKKNAYILDEKDPTFIVPPYMEEVVFMEKRNTPEVDVIVYIDPKDDGAISFKYWEVNVPAHSGKHFFTYLLKIKSLCHQPTVKAFVCLHVFPSSPGRYLMNKYIASNHF
ncbi:uncharacterized protein LOC118419358 [Branchiostoma floridae]|uniref:Uncharacterized protein LOC118419358 n=1 Tax=Branchiostoma floridae TaxID=7739 RepID=A0A9J7LEW9_BRAFL|nr:uncharacterized protein LOC118419358 [Branchiostoma floridae]